MSYIVAQIFQTSSDYGKHGAFAIGIIYLVFCLSNLALSSYITRLIGVKLTLILSSLTYVLFIAANIKYNIWMLYISAFLTGLGAALLWTAQGAYVSISINKYEQANNLASSSSQSFMNGVFFGIHQSHQMMGNLLVSFLFRFDYPQWMIFIIMTGIAGLGVIGLIFLRPVKIPKDTSKILHFFLIVYCRRIYFIFNRTTFDFG
jgi:MFS family permease